MATPPALKTSPLLNKNVPELRRRAAEQICAQKLTRKKAAIVAANLSDGESDHADEATAEILRSAATAELLRSLPAFKQNKVAQPKANPKPKAAHNPKAIPKPTPRPSELNRGLPDPTPSASLLPPRPKPRPRKVQGGVTQPAPEQLRSSSGQRVRRTSVNSTSAQPNQQSFTTQPSVASGSLNQNSWPRQEAVRNRAIPQSTWTPQPLNHVQYPRGRPAAPAPVASRTSQHLPYMPAVAVGQHGVVQGMCLSSLRNLLTSLAAGRMFNQPQSHWSPNPAHPSQARSNESHQPETHSDLWQSQLPQSQPPRSQFYPPWSGISRSYPAPSSSSQAASAAPQPQSAPYHLPEPGYSTYNHKFSDYLDQNMDPENENWFPGFETSDQGGSDWLG